MLDKLYAITNYNLSFFSLTIILYISYSARIRKLKRKRITVNNTAKLWWSYSKAGLLTKGDPDIPAIQLYNNSSSIKAEGNAVTTEWLYTQCGQFEYKAIWQFFNTRTATVSTIDVLNSEVSDIKTSDSYYGSYATGKVGSVGTMDDCIIAGIPGSVGYIGRKSYLTKYRYLAKIDNNLVHSYIGANSGVPSMCTTADTSVIVHGNCETSYDVVSYAPCVSILSRTDKAIVSYHRVLYTVTKDLVVTGTIYTSSNNNGYQNAVIYAVCDLKDGLLACSGAGAATYSNDLVRTADYGNIVRPNMCRPVQCNSNGTSITISGLGSASAGSIIRRTGVVTHFSPQSPPNITEAVSYTLGYTALDSICIDDDTFIFMGNMSNRTETYATSYVSYTESGVYKNGAISIGNSTKIYEDNYIISPNSEVVYFMTPLNDGSHVGVKCLIE